MENKFFLHRIRKDNGTYSKGIEVHDDYGTACRNFHSQIEYRYGNSKFPNVSFVASRITGASGVTHKSECWNKGE